MSDLWLISDTHFFHDNIIQFCGRPFDNSDEMNECLIENWNRVVKPQDKVYHLGDVAMGCKDSELHTLLNSLNGKKRLILGNHDNPKTPAILNNFEKIMLWNGFHCAGISFTGVHIPLPLEALRDGKVCVHGHIHNNILADPHYINVCVEHVGYTPINVEVIADRVKKILHDEEHPPIGSRYLQNRGKG